MTEMDEPLEMPKNAYKTGEVCPVCGEEIWAVKVMDIKEFKRPCRCKNEEAIQEEARIAERRKKEKIERRRESSRIPSRFLECGFKNFEDRPGVGEALTACREWTLNRHQNIENGRGLVLSGPAGTGKTHLGAAILNYSLIDYRSVFWDVNGNLLRMLPGGAPQDEQQRLLEDACRATVLLLDDLGAEKPSEWTQKQLTVIINDRYASNLPTIVTTNWVGSDLRERIGERCYSRLMEMCDVAVLTASDYRRAKR